MGPLAAPDATATLCSTSHCLLGVALGLKRSCFACSVLPPQWREVHLPALVYEIFIFKNGKDSTVVDKTIEDAFVAPISHDLVPQVSPTSPRPTPLLANQEGERPMIRHWLERLLLDTLQAETSPATPAQA
jgi:hypothetical protein